MFRTLDSMWCATTMAVALILAPRPAWAVQADTPAAHDHGTVAAEPGSREPASGGTQTQRAALDGRIAGLVAEMNAASGEARTDAMARLLTALVEARALANEPAMGCSMMKKMKESAAAVR